LYLNQVLDACRLEFVSCLGLDNKCATSGGIGTGTGTGTGTGFAITTAGLGAVAGRLLTHSSFCGNANPRHLFKM
jgi:hypothetical protein